MLEGAFILTFFATLTVAAVWPWKRKPAPLPLPSEEITELILTPRYRGQRNKPCPCGSGKKFKVCCA